MTYDEIKKANDAIKTMDIKGKEYAEVSQRIKAFRMLYPEGFIHTDLLSVENGVCIIKASVGYYENGHEIVLGTGTAYEKEGSSFINKTSYIENCETSAIGRALSTIGLLGSDSVASADEVQNAILNQERKASDKQIEVLASRYVGENLTKLLKANNITKLEDLPMSKASDLIRKLGGKA